MDATFMLNSRTACNQNLESCFAMKKENNIRVMGPAIQRMWRGSMRVVLS